MQAFVHQQYVYVGSNPNPVTVTTRPILSSVRDRHELSFATVTGSGIDSMYMDVTDRNVTNWSKWSVSYTPTVAHNLIYIFYIHNTQSISINGYPKRHAFHRVHPSGPPFHHPSASHPMDLRSGLCSVAHS